MQTRPLEAFAKPQRVEIHGYTDDAMKPFLSRNGQTLLFNNRNDPSVNTDLHLATRVDALTFRSLGRLASANTADLVLARRTSGGFERHSDSDILLQNVNTDAALEYAAAISSDGRELFFNRVETICVTSACVGEKRDLAL